MLVAETLLVPTFPTTHISAAIGHFTRAVDDFGRGDWEDSVAKIGKFVEAMLKAVATHCHVPFEAGRKFKADAVINALGQLPYGVHDDALRLLIPRACRVAYDLASNRGARHDPGEINPNAMDANFAIHTSSWILAEAIRYAQKGVVDPSQAKALVESLTEKRYPLVEEVDGRLYVHAKKKSAVEVALVVLAQSHPKRVRKSVLIDTIKRNGFSVKNAKMAVNRISNLVDYDDGENLKLLAPGLQRAEEIIKRALESFGT